MKELDVLLERYLGSGFESSDAVEKEAFERLLELQDPQLYALLLGTEAAEDDAIRNVVETIRNSPHR